MAKQKTPEERLNGFFLSQMVDLAGEPWPQGLFHYTTSAGMRAIISSGVLRAHNVEQMNDFTEGRYAASVMRAFIDRQYAIESNADATKLFEAMREQLSTVDLTDVFALSFTTDGDELGMWRLYADRGRGFSFSVSIRKALNWAGQMHQGAIMRCCYNAERLERFCCQALSKIRSIYLEDLAEGVALAPAGYSALFFELAVWCAPLFKSSAWRDEKEWRFVFMRPKTEHKTLEGERRCIELPLGTDDPAGFGPISAICAGPDCDCDEDIVPLQAILAAKGYGADYPVHLSVHHKIRIGRRPPIVRQPAVPG